MATYEAWKLAVDVALCLSLLILAFRFFRTGHLAAHSKRGAELEAALRRLIQDAKEAGSELNDELYRRQLALEKALSGIEQAEGRIRTVAALADEKCSAIDAVLARTQHVMEELHDQPQRAPQAQAMRTPPRAAMRDRIETIDEAETPAVEMRHETRAPARTPGNPAQRAYSATQKAIARPKAAESDAYTAWLDEAAGGANRPEHQASLRDEIEKEITPARRAAAPQPDKESVANRLAAALSANKAKHGAAPKGVDEMENIYQLAENLLRAGHGIEAVIARTKLPPRRVEALSQMVEREKSYGFEEEETAAPEQPAQNPAGLGALAAGRRMIESL